MAETWTCPVCNTVNDEDSESCMVCHTDKSGTASADRSTSESPWGIVFPKEEPLPPPPPPSAAGADPPACAAPVRVPSADTVPAANLRAKLP